MGPKDRQLLHRFLLAGPMVVGPVIAFFVFASLDAAPIWPEAKAWVAARFLEVRSLMTWWALVAAIVLSLTWLWGVLATRERDDKSLEGRPIGPQPMGNDNRKGIFNDAPNQGTQNYYEGPQQRIAPPYLVAALEGAPKDNVTVQVRIYGTDHEMQTYGRDLAGRLADAGLKVILFDGDNGTRYLEGSVIEPAPNRASQELGRVILNALHSAGAIVSLGSGPEAWADQNFVRIGVGANG